MITQHRVRDGPGQLPLAQRSLEVCVGWLGSASRGPDVHLHAPVRLRRPLDHGLGTAAIAFRHAPRRHNPHYALLRMTHTRMPRG